MKVTFFSLKKQLMASELKNLSVFEGTDIPNASNMKFGIVWAEWNHKVTHALMQGAYDTLKKYGATDESILVKTCLLYTSRCV